MRPPNSMFGYLFFENVLRNIDFKPRLSFGFRLV